MNVKGLSIKDITTMSWDDINKLNTKEMKQLTSRLVSASNKRIRALEKTKMGKLSYAYQMIEERGRKFSVKGKNLSQLKSEFSDATRFLNAKTSTVKGWKKVRTQMEERISDATNKESLNWGTGTWKKYWKVYRKFEEKYGGTFKKGDSDRMQKFITEVFSDSDKRRSADFFQQQVDAKYTEMYEEPDEDIDETDEYEDDEEW